MSLVFSDISYAMVLFYEFGYNVTYRFNAVSDECG